MAKPLSAQMKKAKQEQLRQKAEANTTVMKKTGREEPVAINQGTPNDHSLKYDSHSSVKFGMSKGVTKNMDNYESLRVDVWLSDEVLPGETIHEAYARIEEVIDEVLEEAVMSTAGE